MKSAMNRASETDTPPSQADLIMRVAWMYHCEGLTQHEIAAALTLPRTRVIKLLRSGFDQGFVTVQLSHRYYNCLSLEADLKAAFALKDAVVVPSPQNPERAAAVLGFAAAAYLPKVLKRGLTLGTAWGTTILEVARHFKSQTIDDASVVMLLGGIPDSLPAVNPNDIARMFAERLGGRTYYLYAPALVEKSETRDRLLLDKTVQTPLALAKASNVALLGAGACTPGATLAKTGILSGLQLAELRARGAVGDILARFFDLEGRPVETEVDGRVIGLELADLRRIDTTILVAGGAEKVPAILGALRGGYVNTLVTDEHTCQAVLEERVVPEAVP